MKISIPLTDIMIAPGKRFDPASCSEAQIIEHVRRIYGVIAETMDISVKDGMVHIVFKNASPEKFKEAMLSLKKGINAALKKQFPKALKLFQEVLTVIPESIDARRNMAKVYLEQNKLEQAKQLLHECIQINPKDAWACVMLGNIYARNENKPDLGAFYYDLCLEHHPDDAMAMSNYAALMMETKQFQKAEVLFKKALKIQDIPNAYYGLAFLYRMANELEASRQVLETFFTRTADVKEVKGSPVYKEAENLYREVSKAVGGAGKGN